MNVYLHKSVNYSDMQGPAPSGFHVPLITEWQGLKTIMNGLGLTTVDGWRINLHIPLTGGRDYSDAVVRGQGEYCFYWASSPAFDYPGRAYVFYMRQSNSTVNAADRENRTWGYSLRCFKNSFELPTSSWTVITGTLGGAGIFRNQTEGLISITSDGTTGYTIQDKNLGATTVYSDGATLSEANCGKYYQWGNNYGFPFTGSVTTSSTKVNASSYGPGNYYSSSTFILGNPFGGQDWSSVQNDNLRGGVTGVGGQFELKNAYIGEYKEPVEYSYDFRNKNWSTLQSDGWTLGSGTGTIGYSSNGIYNTTYATSLQLKNLSNISFSDASKIYLEITAASNMLYSNCYLGIGAQSSNGVGSLYACIGQENNYLRSSYDMIYIHNVSSSPETTIKVTLDINNATYTFDDGVGGQSSGDIASGYITRIKNSSGIYVGISINSSGTYSTTYIKNIKIIKEY